MDFSVSSRYYTLLSLSVALNLIRLCQVACLMEKRQLMSGVMVDIKLGHVNLFCLDYKHAIGFKKSES